MDKFILLVYNKEVRILEKVSDYCYVSLDRDFSYIPSTNTCFKYDK